MGAGGAIQVQRTVVARALEVAMDRAPGMKFLMGEVTPVRLLIIQQAPGLAADMWRKALCPIAMANPL